MSLALSIDALAASDGINRLMAILRLDEKELSE